MPDFKYNLRQAAENDLRTYRVIPNTPVIDQAYYTNTQVDDYAANYGFTDWSKDAAATYYRDMQLGEMRESEDRMSEAIRDKANAQAVLDAWEAMEYASKEEDREKAQQQALQSLELLRKNGTWSNQYDPNVTDLKNIISKSDKKYKEALENYNIDLKQYNEGSVLGVGLGMKHHDVSQYYNRKSNEAVMGWGNWYYKLPSTQGTSNTSVGLQTISMVGGMSGAWAGGKAGAATGASIGSIVPGAGTAVGAAIGSAIGSIIGGVAGSQFAGGKLARENESHMEAFMAQYEKFMKIAAEKNLDLDAAAENIKQQLNQKGYDTKYMTREMLIQAGISMQDIASGLYEFDKAAEESYKDTRRVYEQNNALGFGEVLSDLTYIVPLGKWTISTGKGLAKGVNKLTGNKLSLGFGKRFQTGVEISKLGSKLRNKQLWDLLKNAAVTYPFRSLMEGSEEGAQAMTVDEFLEGEFSDEYANDDFLDALDDGQVFSDLWRNTKRRFGTVGALLNLNDEYKDDQQFMEEVFMGMLLPFTNIQGIAAQSFHLKSTYDKIFKSKRVGDYITSSLETKDVINRNAELYKTLREGVGSTSTYLELLQNVKDLIKQRDSEGKTKFNLDTTVLTDDGSVPTDADIDMFFDNQIEEYNALRDTKKSAKKELQQLAFENKTDEDLFLALRHNADQDVKMVNLAALAGGIQGSMYVQKLAEDFDFKKNVESIIGREPDENELAAYATIANLNSQIDFLNETTSNAIAETRIRRMMSGFKGYVTSNVMNDAAESMVAYVNARDAVIKERDELINALVDSENISEREALLLLDAPTTNAELYSRFDEHNTRIANIRVLSDHTTRKKEKLHSADKELISSILKKYKDAQHRQAVLGDNANEAARKGVDPTIPAEVKDTPIAIDLTNERMVEEENAAKEGITNDVERFKQLIDSIPETSYLYSIVRQIKRGLDLVGDNPMAYARYVNRLMKRLKDDYTVAEKNQKLSDEEKQQLKNLKDVVSNFDKQLSALREYNAETKARAERHNLDLTTDSTVWFDAEGNRYTFDNKNAEYSENEGVIIRMRPVIEDKDKDTELLLKNLEESKKKLEKEDTDESKKIIESIDELIDAIKENQENKSKQVIVMRADDPFLSTLTSKDNLGNERSFKSKLDSWDKKAKSKIKANKENRKVKQELSAEGDVYVFDFDSKSSNNKNSPAYRQRQIEDSPEREVLAHAITLDTKFGHALASKLMNPYFAAKYWHGRITMPYANPEQAKPFFKDKDDKKTDWGIISKFGKTLDRYKAIATFNKIGGQIVYAREHDKALDEAVYTPLEQLAKGEVEEVKFGNSKVTKKEYDNMIYALPLMAIMYQPHLGKQSTKVHLVDFAGRFRTNEPSAAEYNSRAELINNLLLSYKRNNEEVDLSEDREEGFTEEKVDQTFGNGVNFGEGSVQLVYGDFDYNLTTEMNQDLPIYRDEFGNQMNRKQIYELYKNKLPAAIDAVLPYLDELVELLNDTNMGFSVTKEGLTQILGDTTKLSELMFAVVRYGDGVIDLHKTFMPTVSQILGGIKNDKKGVKIPNLDRAKKLLFFFQNKTPDLFLSHKNTQDEEKRTPPVQISVEDSLQNKYFRGNHAIKITTAEGEQLDYTNTPENVDDLTVMFNGFEKALRESHNAEEFLNVLKANYKFELNGSEEAADNVLVEYFINRRFSRLKTPSNIVQAITLGKSTPLNNAVNYENFNRRIRHKQDRIDKVSALNLVKDENGKYHFSLEEWEERNLRLKGESEEKHIQTEFETKVEQARKEVDEIKKQIEAISKKDALITFMTNYKSVVGEDVFNAILRLKKDGTYTVRKGRTLAGSKLELINSVQAAFDSNLEQLEQQYKKDVRREMQEEDEFEGMTTLPLTFAFGSYDDGDGASIVRFDKNGNKIKMQLAKGTSGAMYMVIPAFLTASRTQIPVKLNPKRFDKTTATFIASLLRFVSVQKAAPLDAFAEDVTLPEGFRVTSDMSFKSILDSLIYVGKDAVLNNASDEDYERLLYVDNNGDVHFGESVLTEDNFDQLVEFIQTKKTYRIDRMKAGNHNATFGGNVTITTTSNSPFGDAVILSRLADDNYIASIIDDGWLLTDLNQSQESHLFTTPNLYIKYNKKRSFVAIPNDSASEGSAASAKKKLKQEVSDEAVIDADDMEQYLVTESSDKTIGQYFTDFFKGLSEVIVKAYTDKEISGTEFLIGFFGNKSKKLNKNTYPVTLTKDDQGLPMLYCDSDVQNKLRNNILAVLDKGLDVSIVVMDEENTFLKIGGKKYIQLEKDKFKGALSGNKTKKGKSTANEGDSSSTTALEMYAEALKENAAAIREQNELIKAGYSMPGPSAPQPTSAERPAGNSTPSGYVGLSAPKETGSKKTVPEKKAEFVEGFEEARVTKKDGKYTAKFGAVTLTWDDSSSLDNVQDQYDNEMEKLGLTPEDEDYGEIEKLYRSSKTNQPAAENIKPTAAKQTLKGTLSNSKPPTPITKLSTPANKPVSTPSTKPSVELAIPTWEDIMKFASNNTGAKELLTKLKDLQNRSVKNSQQYKNHLEVLYSKFIQQKYGASVLDAARFVKNNEEILRVANQFAVGKDPSAKSSSIYDFLNNHVLKEDFDAAYEAVERILGKGFNFSFLPKVEKRYDHVRQAMMYVFGECASSGIRLFRDANNKIARGSFYHESFHKISLFVLSKEERDKMYQDAREKYYDDLWNASDTEVEEYLADIFAQFVLDAKFRKQGKYYSSNPIYKVFQKLFDIIRRLINRLTSRNITPQYVDMNKLFRDMYSGRYAYAKATSDNLELFEKTYGKFVPFAGFKVDDVEIANSSTQYYEILRDLVARFIRMTDLLYVKDGNVTFDAEVLRLDLQNDLDSYRSALEHLQDRKKWVTDPILKTFSTGDIDEAIMRMLHLVDTNEMILQDGVWSKWAEILTNFIDVQFNVSRQKDEDPLSILNDTLPEYDLEENSEVQEEDESEPSGGNSLHISVKRDSYMTSMFDASHPNMKLLLWSIAQFNPNDPASGKFTPDGLIEYANVKLVYRDAVTAISGSANVEDMLMKLEIAANRDVKERGDYSLMQLHSILSDSNIPQAIRNRFFTDFVRNINNFTNHTYQAKEKSIGDEIVVEYTAAVKNGNTERVVEKLNVRWKTEVLIALDRLKSSSTDPKKLYKQVKDKIDKMNLSNLSEIRGVLLSINNAYGFGVSDDVAEDAIVVQKLMQRGDGKNLLYKLIQPFYAISTSSIKRDYFIDDFVKKLFSEKGILTAFSETMSVGKRANPKTDTVRGPKGNKIYAISAYNFITRLFDTRVKQKEWLQRMKNNPYCQHSVWLKELLNASGSDLATVDIKLGTVLDDDYMDSTADIQVTEKEDLLNRFTSVLSGKHLIPSLANKRFAADIVGFQVIEDMFDSFGNINPRVIDRFVGYLADEILAISDAMYTRQWFIDNLNNILKPVEKFTIDSFSDLSATKQEELFKNNKEAALLLNRLVKQYHFGEGAPEYVEDLENDRLVRRAFHIDLRKGSGYNFRHFKSLQRTIKLTKKQIDEMSKDVFTDNSRKLSADLSKQIAEKYRHVVVEMLQKNILATIDKFIEKRIILGNRPSISNNALDKESLSNRHLPTNLIANWNGKKDNKKAKITSSDIYNAIGYFTVSGMADVIEFEKIVSGDIGFHKDITSVNKRYSGITSTIQITSEKGTIQNVFGEDRLYDSETFNSITLNTSLVINKEKFKADVLITLGVDALVEIEDKGGKVKAILDHTQLLQDGELKDSVKNAPLVRRYVEARKYGKTLGLSEKGKPLTDEELAIKICEGAKRRFEGFLNNDPTDASVLITSDLYRQFRQREGNWNDVDEACHNLLENYDRITLLSKTHESQLKEICDLLGIKYKTLLKNAKIYDEAIKRNDRDKINQYKGFIYSATQQLQATSLKYVYYGEPANRHDKLYVPTYDKMALSPVYKIFADGHEMKELYDFMAKNQIDMVKLESAVKSGGVPCFELYDRHGKVDKAALEASVVQNQYFNLIGKQLNTDAHEMHDTALLTQFMKIAMMNVQDDVVYDVNGETVKGSALKNTYNKILKHFTEKGLLKFKKKYGIDENGIDKAAFMKKIQNMAATQGLPADTIASFGVVGDDYIIHPAGIPNMRWIQSRILSEMGKTVIDTIAPGQALYQTASMGYDNIFNLKQHPDKHLLMPGEKGAKRMQIKLSISFFKDVIEEAKKKGVTGYNLDNFEDQRRFILDNKELFALSYRVPTQGQNSTLPVEIVDLFPPQRGAIVSFPAGVTALTGSDFDIDKMFLARPNYEIRNSKVQKIRYIFTEVMTKDLNEINDKQLQNALLDMYQAVLTSKEHYLAANTPLDVCTKPVKEFITNEIRNGQKKAQTSLENMDGYFANPIFLTAQKIKNAASDGGIAPMALNSVFRFFIQVSGLKMRPDIVLQEFGLDNLVRYYDNDGEDILDLTSALINAFVDAVKDSYIGEANVNGYTFDVTSFLISAGEGNDTFAFLCQPIIKDLADTYNEYKNGKVGVTDDEKVGEAYLDDVKEKWFNLLSEDEKKEDLHSLATLKEMDKKQLLKQLKNPTPLQQFRYLNLFLHFKNVAEGYRDAIKVAQIDTKKYGINSDAIISFMQKRDQFVSDYNLTFSNPELLFDNTFLGSKYENSLVELFSVFEDTILEFSPVYKQTADELSRQWGKYGRWSSSFLKVVGPKIKAVMFAPFFNEYLANRYRDKKPLKTLLSGIDSVPGRFNEIKNKCLNANEGVALFEVLNYHHADNPNIPHFFTIDRIVNEDMFVKSNVQAAISELCNSEDADVRQWVSDFMVYMFYLTGGNDANAGGLIKTTLYDIIPPQHLANLYNGKTTFNQYVEQLVMNRQRLEQQELDQIMRLVALTDDRIIKTYDPRYHRKTTWIQLAEDGNVLTIKKGSGRFFSMERNEFDKFIKVYNTKTLSYDIYQLGNVVTTAPNSAGKTFTNPLYFKINKLGYRNSTRAAFSVRTDGQIVDGNIYSLMNQNNKFTATTFEQLSERSQKAVMGALGLKDSIIQNPSEYYADSVYRTIDLVDAVYFVKKGLIDRKINNYVKYAEYKNKPFYIISDIKTEKEYLPVLEKGSSYTIIGSEMFMSTLSANVKGIGEVNAILDANNSSVVVSYGEGPTVDTAYNRVMQKLDVKSSEKKSETKTSSSSENDLVKQLEWASADKFNLSNKQRPSEKC